MKFLRLKKAEVQQPNKPKPTTTLPDNMEWSWDPNAADWVAVMKNNTNVTPPLYNPQNQNVVNTNATTYMSTVKSSENFDEENLNNIWIVDMWLDNMDSEDGHDTIEFTKIGLIDWLNSEIESYYSTDDVEPELIPEDATNEQLKQELSDWFEAKVVDIKPPYNKRNATNKSLSVLPRLLEKCWYGNGHGRYAEIGNWSIGLGGYDTGYEVSYKGLPIFSITPDNELKEYLSEESLQRDCGLSYDDIEKVLKSYKDLGGLKRIQCKKQASKKVTAEKLEVVSEEGELVAYDEDGGIWYTFEFVDDWPHKVAEVAVYCGRPTTKEDNTIADFYIQNDYVLKFEDFDAAEDFLYTVKGVKTKQEMETLLKKFSNKKQASKKYAGEEIDKINLDFMKDIGDTSYALKLLRDGIVTRESRHFDQLVENILNSGEGSAAPLTLLLLGILNENDRYYHNAVKQCLPHPTYAADLLERGVITKDSEYYIDAVNSAIRYSDIAKGLVEKGIIDEQYVKNENNSRIEKLRSALSEAILTLRESGERFYDLRLVWQDKESSEQYLKQALDVASNRLDKAGMKEDAEYYRGVLKQASKKVKASAKALGYTKTKDGFVVKVMDKDKDIKADITVNVDGNDLSFDSNYQFSNDDDTTFEDFTDTAVWYLVDKGLIAFDDNNKWNKVKARNKKQNMGKYKLEIDIWYYNTGGYGTPVSAFIYDETEDGEFPDKYTLFDDKLFYYGNDYDEEDSHLYYEEFEDYVISSCISEAQNDIPEKTIYLNVVIKKFYSSKNVQTDTIENYFDVKLNTKKVKSEKSIMDLAQNIIYDVVLIHKAKSMDERPEWDGTFAILTLNPEKTDIVDIKYIPQSSLPSYTPNDNEYGLVRTRDTGFDETDYQLQPLEMIIRQRKSDSFAKDDKNAIESGYKKQSSCLSEFLDGPRYSKEIKIEAGLIKDGLVKYAGFDFNRGTKYAITEKGLKVLRSAAEKEHNEALNEREKLAYMFGFNTDKETTLDTTGKVIKSEENELSLMDVIGRNENEFKYIEDIVDAINHKEFNANEPEPWWTVRRYDVDGGDTIELVDFRDKKYATIKLSKQFPSKYYSKDKKGGIKASRYNTFAITEADGTPLGKVTASSELDAKVKFGIEHPEYADSQSISAKEIKADDLYSPNHKDPKLGITIGEEERLVKQVAKDYEISERQSEFIFGMLRGISKDWKVKKKDFEWLAKENFLRPIDIELIAKDFGFKVDEDKKVESQYEQTTNTKEPYPNPSETPHDDIVLENHDGWVNTAKKK